MVTAENVIPFLQDNPEFLMAYLDQFSQSQNKGKVRSFTEAQLAMEKIKNDNLVQTIEEMIRNAKQNETIMQKLLAMDLALLSANTVRQVSLTVKKHLQQDFGMDNISMKLDVKETKNLHIPSDMLIQSDGLRAKILACHQINGTQKLLHPEILQDLNPTAAESFLYLPLSWQEGSTNGLLVIAHQNPNHFHQNLQLDFVTHLAQVISVSLKKALHIK